MKIYISQPMFNKTEEEILKARNDIVKKFETAILIDSIIKDEPPIGVNIPLWYFANSITKMSEADTIVLIGDWKNYRGCRLEYEIAKQYGLNIIDLGC